MRLTTAPAPALPHRPAALPRIEYLPLPRNPAMVSEPRPRGWGGRAAPSGQEGDGGGGGFPASGPRAEGETGFWHGKEQPVPRAELNLCWGGGRGAGRGCRAGEGGQRVPGGGHGGGGTHQGMAVGVFPPISSPPFSPPMHPTAISRLGAAALPPPSPNPPAPEGLVGGQRSRGAVAEAGSNSVLLTLTKKRLNRASGGAGGGRESPGC